MSDASAVVGQSSYDGLWWLCLVIVIGLFIGIAYFIYWLGQLPGEIAHSRGHPQATAIAACGWIGLIFPPLWPIAFVWAFLVPAGRDLEPPADLTGIQAGLKAAAARLLEIEGKLGKAGAA